MPHRRLRGRLAALTHARTHIPRADWHKTHRCDRHREARCTTPATRFVWGHSHARVLRRGCRVAGSCKDIPNDPIKGLRPLAEIVPRLGRARLTFGSPFSDHGKDATKKISLTGDNVRVQVPFGVGAENIVGGTLSATTLKPPMGRLAQ